MIGDGAFGKLLILSFEDSEEHIISYRDTDGVLHEEKGISTKEIKTDNIEEQTIYAQRGRAKEDRTI